MQLDSGEGRAPTTIAIADAVDILRNALGDVGEARRVLVERAQLGDLQGTASRAQGFFDGITLDERDWQIPPDLWLRLGEHSEAEWQRGDLTAAQSYDRYAELQEGYATPLRLIGVRVEASGLNGVRASLPVDWLNAHSAIAMLLPMFGSGVGLAAARALAKRAHSGLVRTRARLFKWEELKGGGYAYDRKVEQEAQFALLPKGFWWADGEKALTQNWVSGDFSTWIDRNFHWQAFGVEFARCDVQAMLPAIGSGKVEGIEREQHMDSAQEPQKLAEPLPTDESIEAKMLELIGFGMKRDVAAKVIRQIAGFEAVGNEHARRVVNGKLALGRPRESA